MSNGHQLELIRRDDGGLFINYWDWRNGRDTLWEVDLDGTVHKKRVLGKKAKGVTNLGQDLLMLMDALDDQE